MNQNFTKLFTTLCLSVSVFSTVFGQNISLQTSIDKILKSRDLEHCNISLTVLDIESDSIEAAYRPYRVGVPASSLKVLTTLTALEVLGEDFTYQTDIAYDGTLEADGTLKGNVYIVGSGDPTLGSGKFDGYPTFEQVLKKISDAVKIAGITCVDGKIIADESIYNSYPIAPTWQWNDLGNYYASGAWGININENKYAVYFTDRGTIGRRPKIKGHYPKVPNIEFSNELAIDSSHTGDQAYIFGGPYNYKKRIVGTIPQGDNTFTIKGSIPDPPKFMAYHVGLHLNQCNIQVSDGYSVNFTPKYNKKKNQVLSIVSPPLGDIVRRANLESNNLYCESLLKTLGHKIRNGGSGQLGISAIKRQLRKHNIDHSCLIMEDGSGLSARNNVCSYLLADFMGDYAKRNGFSNTTKYLAQGGVSGTIRGHFKGTSAQGNVWAKSGFMTGVLSYTGLVKTKSGSTKSFSVIVNGYTAPTSTIRTKLIKVMTEIQQKG